MDTFSKTLRKPSYWEAQHWPVVPGEVDVAVVGGGLVGLQTALYLNDLQPELTVTIVDRDDPPAGASTRNAGFACVGSLTELADDIDQIGFAATVELVARRYRGLNLLAARLPDGAIDWCGNLEAFRAGQDDDFVRAKALLPQVNVALRDHLALAHDVFSVVPATPSLAPTYSLGCIRNCLEGQLDPGAMVRHLQAETSRRHITTIHAPVSELRQSAPQDYELTIGGTTLHARQVVLATNAFTRQLVESPIQPALNQVIVSSPVAGLDWTQPIHLEKGYGYVRRIGDRVLVGGFRHLSAAFAKTDQFQLDPTLGRHLRTVLQGVLPKGYRVREEAKTAIFSEESGQTSMVSIDYEWCGVLGLGTTRSPQVSRDEHGIVHAAGLGGMGIALGSLLAQEAAEMILRGA